MGFGPTYVAHIPPLEGWYRRDPLCYGAGARVAYITAKANKKTFKSVDPTRRGPESTLMKEKTAVRPKSLGNLGEGTKEQKTPLSL